MIARIAATLVCFSILWATALAADPLTGTTLLTETRPLDEVMVTGIDNHALAEIVKAHHSRSRPDGESRKRFVKIIGAVDRRIEPTVVEFVATENEPSQIAANETYTVDIVRWQVLDGVTAEGLWLRPVSAPIARVIAIPDADWTPEMIAGLVSSPTTYAADLAALGCEVLVPTLINRDYQFSSNAVIGQATNLSHREFIYRQAFEVGRHVIGYEVQKVLSAVDYFADKNQRESNIPIVVVGVSEGGLLALYSGAIDTRIDATIVSGYFNSRDNVWEEPIYRNVWNLLTEFGDAELATLIAPRLLYIERAPAVPEVNGPQQVNRQIAAPGKILRLWGSSNKSIPELRSPTEEEITRAAELWRGSNVNAPAVWLKSDRATTGQPPLPTVWLRQIVGEITGSPLGTSPLSLAASNRAIEIDSNRRQERQVKELVSFTQKLLRDSHRVRERRFAKLDRSSVDAWNESAESMRDQVYKELIGKLPVPTMPPEPRTRKIIHEKDYTGYEVVLNVYPEVIAAGVLLLPSNLRPDEKRPVVVCQHGLEGTPMLTIGGPDSKDFHYYKGMSVELVRRGFIVYAPQNPYRGEDRFRTLQRKSNPLGRSLFSYIIPQHLVTLRWLATLPNVDRDRIGFYGLSYGGKTAMRVPPMLPPTE